MSNVNGISPSTAAPSAVLTASDRAKVLKLSTTNNEILAIVDKVFSGDKASATDQNLLNMLLSFRSQTITASSNAIRQFFDGTASVIRNIRA